MKFLTERLAFVPIRKDCMYVGCARRARVVVVRVQNDPATDEFQTSFMCQAHADDFEQTAVAATDAPLVADVREEDLS